MSRSLAMGAGPASSGYQLLMLAQSAPPVPWALRQSLAATPLKRAASEGALQEEDVFQKDEYDRCLFET
jgi:hypothetical protein